MKEKIKNWLKPVLFTAGGALVGLAYYYFVRCPTGACPLTSNPFITMAYMGFIGWLLSGIFGKGLGQSIQKLGFLPEQQNDMIFSIICEELGLFGGIAVILIFLLLIWRLMIIANNASDLFGALLVVGVLGHIAIQVILNVAVVTNSMPNTGVSLPFISYGGSSILFLLIEMGLVMSVARGIKVRDV